MKRFICILLCFFFVFSIKVSAVSVSAKSAILICGDTGEVLYEKNADEILSMASTTKIMTGIILCESTEPEATVTVTAEMLRVEGSSMGLNAGDKVTMHDLLFGLMLCSGNDAANVIAYTLGGSLNGFAHLMNEKAKLIGMQNTNFVTPSGLDSPEHYTTARDMAVLTRYAMQNKRFCEAVSAKSATVSFGNPETKRTITNHNRLLSSVDGVIGVKTGFTKKSGRCLVSAAKRDGKYLIAVTLNDPDDWNDHKQMLEYGFNRLCSIDTPTVVTASVPVISGKKSSVGLTAVPTVISAENTEKLSSKLLLPKFLYAPVKKGDTVGIAQFYYGDNRIAQTKVIAAENVEIECQNYNFFHRFINGLMYILSSILEK